MLQTFVRRQWVLSAISSMAELTHIQGIGLFVLVLKVSLQWVVAGERTAAVGTFLRLVDAATCGWWHAQWKLWHGHNTNAIPRLWWSWAGNRCLHFNTGIGIGWTVTTYVATIIDATICGGWAEIACTAASHTPWARGWQRGVVQVVDGSGQAAIQRVCRRGQRCGRWRRRWGRTGWRGSCGAYYFERSFIRREKWNILVTICGELFFLTRYSITYWIYIFLFLS